jgi:hypothetical protein
MKGIRIGQTKEGRQPDESHKIRIGRRAKGGKKGGRFKRREEEKTTRQVTTEALLGNLKNTKCLPVPVHVIKAYCRTGGRGSYSHFEPRRVDGGAWSIPRQGSFAPRKRIPVLKTGRFTEDTTNTV